MADPPVDVPSVSCLGDFVLTLNGPEGINLRPRASELFVLLLLLRGKPISRSSAASQIWYKANEDSALDSLRVHLKHLRDALGPQAWRVQATDRNLSLDIRGVQVDMFRFQQSMRTAMQRGDASGMEMALRMYGGDLLPKGSAAAIVLERAALSELFVNGSEALAERLLLANQRDRALQILWRTLKLYPLCESVVGLMLRLAESDAQQAGHIFATHQDAVRKKLAQPVCAKLVAQFRRISRATARRAREAAELDRNPKSRINKVPVPQHILIGRDVELERIKNRLAQSSLVTLVGPCGVGKTRLAIEIGLLCASNYRNGAVFVDLSQLAPGESVERITAAINAAVEVERGADGGIDTLAGFLAKRHMLLILDNAEHLPVSVVVVVRALLQACASLTILITSQIELIMDFGAHLYIRPLRMPDSRHATLDELRESSAAQLFENTARNCRDDFALSNENAPTVERILRTTDGLPLAIHLVASTDFLTLEEILKQLNLDGGLASLEAFYGSDPPTRSKSPVQAVAWSYNLLSVREQKLLTGVSVFVGGWFREAIEGVFGSAPSSDVKPTVVLDRLCARSLVERIEWNGHSRYRLLEVVREYALARMRESDQITSIADRHLDYYLDCIEGIVKLRNGEERDDALRRLPMDLDNLRAALYHGLNTNQIEKALKVATGLARFFCEKGLVSDGQAWMERVISLSADAAPVLQRNAYHGIASIAFVRNDYERAQAYWEQCLAISKYCEDENWILQDHGNLGNIALALDDFGRARSLFERCLKGYRGQDNSRGIARSLANLALVAKGEKAYAAAKDNYAESITIFRELNDKYNLTLGLNNFASILISCCDYSEAHAVLAEAIKLSREQENDVHLGHSLSSYVTLAVAQCDPKRAATLMGAEEALRERIKMPLPMEAQSEYQCARLHIMGQLGQDTFKAMIHVGRSTSLHQLCQYARGNRDLTG